MLTEGQLDGIDVVLVSPRNPLNIGAVARAMANFGFARMKVVAPFEPHWREAKSAIGAEHLLDRACVCATPADAVADCTLVVGTGTLTHRKPEQPVVSPAALAPRIAEELVRGGRVAILFGPEKHGLTREDLSLCHLLVEIPTDARQPSMNLGQAVAVCLYEVVRTEPGSAASPESATAPVPVASRSLDRLADLIEETMSASGYSPRTMQAANRHDLRLALRRLRWTEPDVRRALGLFRRILWRLRPPKG